MNEIINDHFSNSKSLIIVGDFNVHFEKNELRDTISLSDLMSSFGLSQLVVGPTHTHGHTLDLIFLNTFELQTTTSSPVDFDIGDHFLVNLVLKNVQNNTAIPASKSISYRNLKGINLEEFSTELCSKLNTLHDNVDFPTKYSQISILAHETLDSHAPLITKTISNKSDVHWQDSEYRTERALRRKYERVWKKALKESGIKTGPEREAYIEQRKKCAHLATLKRSQYYRNLIQKNDGYQSALF